MLTIGTFSQRRGLTNEYLHDVLSLKLWSILLCINHYLIFQDMFCTLRKCPCLAHWTWSEVAVKTAHRTSDCSLPWPKLPIITWNRPDIIKSRIEAMYVMIPNEITAFVSRQIHLSDCKKFCKCDSIKKMVKRFKRFTDLRGMQCQGSVSWKMKVKLTEQNFYWYQSFKFIYSLVFLIWINKKCPTSSI